MFTQPGQRAVGNQIADKLVRAGLRLTRPRRRLAKLLFGGSDRHVSAEDLFRESTTAGHGISLATVYNTLNQFTAAGLLREIAVEGHKSYFDTRVDPHYHYLNEATGELYDAAPDAVEISRLAEPPEGLEICEVQIVIRLKAKGAASSAAFMRETDVASRRMDDGQDRF